MIMETIIEIIDISKTGIEGSPNEITNISFSGITILPRIGEDIYLNLKHYKVDKIQHCFKQESNTKTKQIIKISIK